MLRAARCYAPAVAIAAAEQPPRPRSHPERLPATSPAPQKTVAEWRLDGLAYGLHSNAPLGPAVTDAAAGGAKACTQLVFTNGTLGFDSSLVGKRSADLAPIAQNITLSALAQLDKARGGKLGNLTLTVKDATFSFDISPEKTPGVHRCDP
jgi:hypothetical protein